MCKLCDADFTHLERVKLFCGSKKQKKQCDGDAQWLFYLKKYIYMTLHATYVIFSYFEYCDPAWFCCIRKRLENSKHVRPNGVGPRSVTLPKKSREKTFRSEKERCCSIIL